MSLSREAFDRLENHWAVESLSKNERKRAVIVADYKLVSRAVGAQLHLEFRAEPDDDALLNRAALAYELAAIEGLDAFLSTSPSGDDLREQCAAGASQAYEFLRLQSLPDGDREKIFHVLHLSSLAYCGDRWSDIRRWYSENPDASSCPSVADHPWHHRLLFRLFDCWVRLFLKRGWDDLDRIREIIAGLREDQKNFEKSSFKSGSNSHDQAKALQLISFYHWAKATELLATYMLQGEPRGITASLDKHFEAATDAARICEDAQLEVLMRWLHASAHQMVSGSLWKVAQSINSRVTRFVNQTTKHQAMFELLPPQKAALQEQGLLDQAATAVVIDLPTSGGKTLLAQFRMLQALNQFAEDGGWVAYVVPTRALSAQITRRLRRDFSPIGVQVEQLTGALEVDAIEGDMLAAPAKDRDRSFDILVATPEKLQLVIRNKKIQRPLSLIVVDEAHNMESDSRGLRIELLLAMIKQESAATNFLLMMPFVENTEELARWLANDVHGGRSISMGTSVWKPNERIIGMFKAIPDDSVRAGWNLQYQTLTTTPKTIHLKGTHQVGNTKPLNIPKSQVITKGKQKGMGLQAAAMAKVFSSRGTSIAVGGTIPSVWKMARETTNNLPELTSPSKRIKLTQKFLAAEIDPEFELIEMLGHGVGVHHAGLSDEVRSLMEWLAEEGDLCVLCTTTTLAQGINFPVSSVFLATHLYPYGIPMKPREFWNLAGRAGRMNHDSVGTVGIAEANRGEEITQFVQGAIGEIVSQLVTVVKELDKAQTAEELESVIHKEQWEDFRCYVTHLVHEIKDLDKVLANADASLRNTFGYRTLQETPKGKDRAKKLLEATKLYAQKIAAKPGQVAMADMTGFSFEGVGKALHGINSLERKIDINDLSTDQLFGKEGGMADLFGVMLKIPQLAKNLDEITTHGTEKTQLAEITKAWVNGESIKEIATNYFKDAENNTDAITKACRAIYRNLANNGTWGLSALSRLSGINFDELPADKKREIDLLPAMIYHGVKTEEGVLMRMTGVPRSIAENMGGSYQEHIGSSLESTGGIQQVRRFLQSADITIWNTATPTNSPLSGSEFKDLWGIISGESR